MKEEEEKIVIPSHKQVKEVTKEPESLIHVTTNKKSYQNDETILISGTVPVEIQDPIAFTIFSPQNNLIKIGSTVSNSNGEFQVSIHTSMMKVSGEYTIKVSQGSEKNSTTFDYTHIEIKSNPPPDLSLQLVVPQPIPEPEPNS